MSNPITRNDRNASRRRRTRWLAAALATLAAATAAAAAPLVTIEECLETGTDLVTLPSVAGGTLSASQCRGCETLRLKFDQNTRYFIGKELVPYAKLREAATGGTQRIYVFYRPATRTLSRLSLEAGAISK